MFRDNAFGARRLCGRWTAVRMTAATALLFRFRSGREREGKKQHSGNAWRPPSIELRRERGELREIAIRGQLQFDGGTLPT